MTVNNAFVIYPIYNTIPGAITVKNSSGVTLTSKAVYILLSSGKNGHGGLVRNTGNTACNILSNCPIFNGGSTNTDELTNCHCSHSAQYYGLTGSTFIQDTPNIVNGSGANTNSGTQFDDILRFKTRQQMATTAELQ